MLLYPGILSFQLLWEVRGAPSFDLFEVVSELVVGHYEGVALAGVLDAVGVVVVLGRSLDHDALLSHLVEHRHGVRELRLFVAFLVLVQVQLQLLLFLAHLFVVEEVLRQEADDLVAVLLPELNCYLNALAREYLIFTMPHSHILGIEHD